MLNAKETELAVKELKPLKPLFFTATTEQHREYWDAVAAVENKFREYLGATHAPTFSAAAQDRLWFRAQDTAYAYEAMDTANHYGTIECLYIDLVSFIETVNSLM